MSKNDDRFTSREACLKRFYATFAELRKQVGAAWDAGYHEGHHAAEARHEAMRSALPTQREPPMRDLF